MAQTRLPMRKIKEVLRLKYEAGRGHGEIARGCGVAHSTVLEYLRRAEAAGLGWPLPEAVTEAELERRLFPAQVLKRDPEVPPPDCQYIYDELRRWRSSCALTLASHLGLPVSTTHVAVGSLLGIGMITGKADTRVVRDVLLSWVLTLPIAAALSAATFFLVSH